jgi:TorA maturation chaperone TorD
MEGSEEVQSLLESRAFVYLLFQNIFGSEPSEELANTMSSDVTRQAFEIYCLSDDLSYKETLRTALEEMERLSVRPSTGLEKLRGEYTRLFLGPTDLKAPPWESIYTSTQRTLFQESTLEVRNAYRAQGFLPAEYPRVADDHLALECAFMAQLGERVKNSYREGSSEETRAALEASQQFLTKHLLIWMPSYAIGVAKATEVAFYPIMAKLAKEYMEIDLGVIDELLTAL